jgi:hypothetical protein
VTAGCAFAEICGAVADEVGEEEGASVAGKLFARWL